MSQEAEVKLRLVIDSEGARVVNQITGEVVKTVNAEKDHAAKIAQSRAELEKLRKEQELLAKAAAQGMPAGSHAPGTGLGSGGTGGLPAGSSAFGGGPWPQMTRPGPGGWPSMAGGGAAPTNASQWPSMAGGSNGSPIFMPKEWKEPKKKEDGYSLSMSSLPMAGPIMAGVGIFTAGLATAAQAARDFGEIERDPYLSEGSRKQKIAHALPLGFGYINRSLDDLGAHFSGENEEIARLKIEAVQKNSELRRHTEQQSFLLQRGYQMTNTGYDGMRLQGNTNANLNIVPMRAAAYLEPVHLGSTARGTPGESRDYQEQLSLLTNRKGEEDARRRQNEGKFEREELQRMLAFSYQKAEAVDKRVSEARRMLKIAEDNDANKGSPREAPGTSAKRLDLMRELDRAGSAQKEIESLLSREESAAKRTIQARFERESFGKGPEAHRANLEIFQRREVEAQGQARSVGMMGPAERFASQAYLQQLKELGPEGFLNAPATMKQGAAALFPQTIASMAEKAGQTAFPTMNATAPGEHKFDLSEVREQVDQTRKDLENSAVEMARMIAKETATSVAQFTQQLASQLQQQLTIEFQKLQIEKMIQSNQQK
jgi:hypothetical protein